MLLIAGLVAMATGLRDGGTEEAEIADLVEAIATESVAVTNGYFAGPESVAKVVAASLEADPADEVIIDLLTNLTAAQSNVDGAFIGYPDGSFIDVRRDVETGSDQLRVKTIEFVDGERIVEIQMLDPELGTVDEFSLGDDTYDPRVRPWYIGAQTDSAYWTEPYEFFTSGEPGITHSVPVLDDGGTIAAVVGVDIRLTDLQTFLDGRRPSANGGAAVLNAQGELIAGDTQLLGDRDGDAAIQRLLASSLESDNGGGIAAQLVDADMPRVVAGSLVGQGQTQLLLVDAPEDDFLRGIRSSRRGYALLAATLGLLGIVLLGVGAGLIGRYLDTLGQMARTDPLTGLLNRSALQEEMSSALKTASDVAVMAIDLDNFKTVNDQFGHEGGDQALLRVAKKLQAETPRNAIIGRLGGDEFCIVLINDSDPSETLQSVITAAAGTVDTPHYIFDLELSAGYARSCSQNPKSAELILRQADVAMYQAKTTKGTSLMKFNETMHMRWHDDDERKAVLVDAIDAGQIELHFQPEFDLHNNAVVGAEGLLRWRYPEGGLVPAAQFIDDLERFDLMAGLLPLVFAEATQLANAIPANQEFTIRMNMTAEQLLAPDLLDHIEQAVSETTTHWCFEVSEQVMMDATPQMRSVFADARQLGARVTLDNYGTGHSSLAELQTLPVDEIKIPPVFVHALDDTNPHSSVAAVLIDLAAATDIDAIATGIENECQRNSLIEAGVQQGQGYLLGQPTPAHEFIDSWVYQPIAV